MYEVDLLCYVMLCYVMLCYVMLCYVMLCYVMLCYVMFLLEKTAAHSHSRILSHTFHSPHNTFPHVEHSCSVIELQTLD